MFSSRNYRIKIGSCRILFGPMCSHKSTTLRKEITTLADIGLNVLYVNHQKDVRLTESSDRNLTSHHSGFKGLSDKVSVLKTDCLSQIDVTPYHAIGVDEGQFFEDLDVVVRDWVLNKNKIVIVASLDGNYMMEPFGKAHNLICICNPGDVVKMPAICVKCLSEGDFNPVNAGFTAKLQIDPAVLEGKAQVTDEVGGTDKYAPLCMKCYKEYMQSIVETREPIVSVAYLHDTPVLSSK